MPFVRRRGKVGDILAVLGLWSTPLGLSWSLTAHRFLDSEVLAPDFKERLAKVAAVMCPFVHWWVLNFFPTPKIEEADDRPV